MNFYTHITRIGDTIAYRGYKDGKRIIERRDFYPRFFMPSKENNRWKTLDGRSVKEIKPGTMSDCRDFIDRYRGVRGFEIFGNSDYIYQFIGDEFPNEIQYDPSLLKICCIDIETRCDNGFPNIEEANEPLNAITVRVGDQINVYGVGDYKLDSSFNCHRFDNEEEMLMEFLRWWQGADIDIITGWNVNLFDIPYLVHRLNRVFGDNTANALSPWKKLKRRTIKIMERENTAYEVVGIPILDYLDLYKKFTFITRETYKLDHIAEVELGERKVDWSKDYESLKDFYTKNFQRFMEYNAQDVNLVIRLEEKLKLLELGLALAYSAKVNLTDVFSQVRTWDQIIYHHLNERRIVIPMKPEGEEKDEQYVGAYVKEPLIGMHKWVVSFDINSLYPHLIMQYNISPETRLEDKLELNIDKILNGQETEKIGSVGDMCVAANGTIYRKDFQGFLPELMDKMYADRKHYKNLMIEAKKELASVEDHIKKNSTIELLAKKRKLEFDVSKYHNFQLVRKIQLNSAYGAVGNEWFRYYSKDMAEAITCSGQLSIRWVINHINSFLNKTMKSDKDYVIASDTDSVYLCLDDLVNSVVPVADVTKTVNFLDKFCKTVLQKEIDKSFDQLCTVMNAYANRMVMEREVIADRGIWTAKKHYILNVWDSEGVRNSSPKLKIMGIETSRSSTPAPVREALKQSIHIIMNGDEKQLQDQVAEFKKKFMSLKPEEISSPSSCNGLNDYKSSNTIYKKGTPIAVKGALLFNHHLKRFGIDKKYQEIREGEKVKFIYLMVPNPISDAVISFQSSLPREFDLHRFVDYQTQYEKKFLKPLKTILDTVGWVEEEQSTLDSLFA